MDSKIDKQKPVDSLLNADNWKNRYGTVLNFVYSVRFLVIAWTLLVLVFSVLVTIYFWDKLIVDEFISSILRNIALIAAAAIGLPLVIWRSWVVQLQVDIAQRGLLNERYQKSAEMLGSDILSVRLGGIYTLGRLAEESPQDYHVRVMELLCAFVRFPPKELEVITQDKDSTSENDHRKEDQQSLPYRVDIRAAMQSIGSRDVKRIDIEKQAKYKPVLNGSDLRNQDLSGLNLSSAQFEGANLSGANFYKANFTDAHLQKAILPGALLLEGVFIRANFFEANMSGIKDSLEAKFCNAKLHEADLTDAHLAGAMFYNADFGTANLAGTIFSNKWFIAKGLTQKQFQIAQADPAEKPPVLNGIKDCKTGECISWSKRFQP